MSKRTPRKSRTPDKWRCPGSWTPQQRLARFTKVDPLSGCHIWQRSTKPNGYGQLTYRCQRWMTHRLAWVARHGPIPKGLEVCHRCDERRCCNPEHLQLDSHAENMAMMGAKRRALRRIPLEAGLPLDIPEADLAPILLVIGDREYVGHAVVRVFDPLKANKVAGADSVSSRAWARAPHAQPKSRICRGSGGPCRASSRCRPRGGRPALARRTG